MAPALARLPQTARLVTMPGRSWLALPGWQSTALLFWPARELDPQVPPGASPLPVLGCELNAELVYDLALILLDIPYVRPSVAMPRESEQ